MGQRLAELLRPLRWMFAREFTGISLWGSLPILTGDMAGSKSDSVAGCHYFLLATYSRQR